VKYFAPRIGDGCDNRGIRGGRGYFGGSRGGRGGRHGSKFVSGKGYVNDLSMMVMMRRVNSRSEVPIRILISRLLQRQHRG
jgi:hypothetical protein